MTTQKQGYFQKPKLLLGIFILLGLALTAAIINSTASRVYGIATTAESNTGTGKTLNPIGSRQNPVEVGVPFVISTGQLHVNSIQRDMSDAVTQMNRFNRKPDRGQEWVLVNLTLFCDMQQCNPSSLDFELQGENATYNDNYVMVLEGEFAGSITQGQELTGNLGFIIASSEADVLLAVTDGLHRYYFETIPGQAEADET